MQRTRKRNDDDVGTRRKKQTKRPRSSSSRKAALMEDDDDHFDTEQIIEDPEAAIRTLGDNIDTRLISSSIQNDEEERDPNASDDGDDNGEEEDVWSEFADEDERHKHDGRGAEEHASASRGQFSHSLTAFSKSFRMNYRRTTFFGHNRNTVTCLCVTERHVYFGDKAGEVVCVDLRSRRQTKLAPRHKGSVLCLAASTSADANVSLVSRSTADLQASKTFVVSGGADGAIHIWNAATNEFVATMIEHRAAVTGVCFRYQTHTLYSCSMDSTLRVWNAAEQVAVDRLVGHLGAVLDLGCCGRRCATVGRDRIMRLWNIERATQAEFEAHGVILESVCVLDDQTVLCGGADGTLLVFNPVQRSPQYTIKFAHGYANFGDGTGLEQYVLQEEQARRASAAKSSSSEKTPFLGNAITAIAAFPKSDTFATGSWDSSIRVWRFSPTSSVCIGEVPVCGVVNGIAFSHDGSTLFAAIGKDQRMGRWTVVGAALNGIVVAPLIFGGKPSRAKVLTGPEHAQKSKETFRPVNESRVEEYMKNAVRSKMLRLERRLSRKKRRTETPKRKQ